MKTKLDFEHIYETYYSEVLNYLFYLCKHKELAEDLCQETFLKVYKSIGDFKGQSKVKTWINRIAYNTFLDCVRKDNKCISTYCEDNGFEIPDTDLEEPVQGVIEAELKDFLVQCPIKANYRKLIYLRDWHGYSYKEIAQVLGWKITKVKVSLHRARKQFKEIYADKISS